MDYRKKKKQENYGAESSSFKVHKRIEVDEKVHVAEEEEVSAKEADVVLVEGDGNVILLSEEDDLEAEKGGNDIIFLTLMK